MNEYTDTIQKIRLLREIRASEKLRKRISGLTYALPVEVQQTQFMPGFAFAALVMSVILLFVGVGSGFMLSAQKSKPGSPLYPVKQAIGKVKTPLSATIQEKEAPKVPTPTLTPTPTTVGAPSSVPQNSGKKNIQESLKHIENSIQDFLKKNTIQEEHGNEHQNKDKESNSFHHPDFKNNSDN